MMKGWVQVYPHVYKSAVGEYHVVNPLDGKDWVVCSSLDEGKIESANMVEQLGLNNGDTSK